MKIIPGENPDVWYDITDLAHNSLFAIRRESVTCCGFLGGDSIIIISSGETCANLLANYRPTLPWKDRTNSESADSNKINQRVTEILSLIRLQDQSCTKGPASCIKAWEKIFSILNEKVWFAGSADLYRFHIEISGDIQTFLEDPVYSSRLFLCLRWWYTHEATENERENYSRLPLIDRLRYPENSRWIIKAINLYNHGTYEVSSM